MSDLSLQSVFAPKRLFLGLLALLLAAYLVDFTWYECRVHLPKLGAASGSVHRVRLLAIASKGNKVQYEVDTVQPEEDLPCAHSLFPQAGNRPCWYVAKHANDPIPM